MLTLNNIPVQKTKPRWDIRWLNAQFKRAQARSHSVKVNQLRFSIIENENEDETDKDLVMLLTARLRVASLDYASNRMWKYAYAVSATHPEKEKVVFKNN